MNVDLLKRICAVPTCSFQEDAMVRFLLDHVSSNQTRYGRAWTDVHKNVFIVKGDAEFYPCVAAHIDTVQPLRDVSIHETGGRLIAVDKAMDLQVGYGADDKSGVFMCLELLERFDSIAVALFAGEEVGCRGSRNADKAFFDKVGYVLEFDCPAHSMLSWSTGGEQLFLNNGTFIKRAYPVLRERGITRWQRHPYTDTMAIRTRFPISCMNLSSGYYNWHARTEYIKLADTRAMLQAAEDLVRTLGKERYVYRRFQLDEAEPMIKVTALQVPADYR